MTLQKAHAQRGRAHAENEKISASTIGCCYTFARHVTALRDLRSDTCNHRKVPQFCALETKRYYSVNSERGAPDGSDRDVPRRIPDCKEGVWFQEAHTQHLLQGKAVVFVEVRQFTSCLILAEEQGERGGISGAQFAQTGRIERTYRSQELLAKDQTLAAISYRNQDTVIRSGYFETIKCGRKESPAGYTSCPTVQLPSPDKN